MPPQPEANKSLWGGTGGGAGCLALPPFSVSIREKQGVIDHPPALKMYCFGSHVVNYIFRPLKITFLVGALKPLKVTFLGLGGLRECVESIRRVRKPQGSYLEPKSLERSPKNVIFAVLGSGVDPRVVPGYVPH